MNHNANRTLFLVLRITPKSRVKVCGQWRILNKPPGSFLTTDRSKAVVLVWFLLNVFGVGVSCRNLYSFVVYLYVNDSGSITSVGEERASLSAVVYLKLCGFCLERFPLPLGAWDGLRYFIVALPEPSI